MKFNEDSRVKIPTILHLMQLGYEYLSLKSATWDEATNIFPEIFKSSLLKINPEADDHTIDQLYADLAIDLTYEDIGRAFYQRLTDQSGTKLIDFENFDNNTFHVVTELTYKKDDEEFRPDIILLINGMPLVFIEVKKPNNHEGIIAERNRINTRFKNKKFRHFVNLTQFMVFSNNMEYDDDPQPLQGAFYATSSYDKPSFNYFREEHDLDLSKLLSPITSSQEDIVLVDNNLGSIKASSEFATNKSPDTPTNRICTSLFSRDRLAFLLRYSIAYVEGSDSHGAPTLEKHIMRYPQIFATKAIESKLDQSTRKGIIWHTQGSGKTALAYYNVKHLTDYYTRKGVVPKFYFIVDRLDLLEQASREFKARGLTVHNISSRKAFATAIKSNKAVENDSGNAEITVVNIQRFENDPDVTQSTDYAINIQRVYFLDEVHRSYNPKGSFLANLQESDPNAIRIGLTGTPLLNAKLDKETKYSSRTLFGDYIHKYYYNSSVKDGYTLRLIREEIGTEYKMSMLQALEEIKILKGDAKLEDIYADNRFVSPMLDYILNDFEQSRIMHNDHTIGGMVVCHSSEQAKELFAEFQRRMTPATPPTTKESSLPLAAEDQDEYEFTPKQEKKTYTAALILHDVDTKQERKELREDFKKGNVDFLFVYNMLLTGFDAKRLKKLYVGRIIKSHNLLQALTRVNRTYKDFRYGYVVDFADIKKEFEITNKAYFDELKSELGDEMEHYSDLFKSAEEIEAEIDSIKEALFHYDTQNAEVFSQQVSQIQERAQMLEITKCLNQAKSLYNLIRLSGNTELLEKLDFNKLTILSREANNHLQLLNTKQNLESNAATQNLLNVALEDIVFKFTKLSEAEMVIADELRGTLRKTREGLATNFDPRDPEFITLREELERLFKKGNLEEISQEEMQKNIEELNELDKRARDLERRNQLLKAKYLHDEKYARIHKRLMEKDQPDVKESKLFEALSALKQSADDSILKNAQQLSNESYVERMLQRLVLQELKVNHKIDIDAPLAKSINRLLVKEYLDEYNGSAA